MLNMSPSLSCDKFLEINPLAHPFLKTQPDAVHQVMYFCARPIFVPADLHNFADCVMSVREIY